MQNSLADEPYTRLGNAIILQAVKDYREALKKLSKGKKNSAADYTKREVERFFHSRLFELLTELDPDMLLRKLNEEVSA